MTRQRILIVDDDADFRESLGEVLRHRGYDIALAANTMEAIRLARQEPFGLALIDIVMPGKDGVDCLNEILQIAPATQVRLMTGFAVEARIAAALESGAAQVIKKPVDIPCLIRSLKRISENPTALIAHTEPLRARALKSELERRDLSVQVASNLAQTMALLKSGTEFGVVVLDLRLAAESRAQFVGEALSSLRDATVLLCHAGTDHPDELGVPEAQHSNRLRIFPNSVPQEDILGSLEF